MLKEELFFDNKSGKTQPQYVCAFDMGKKNGKKTVTPPTHPPKKHIRYVY